MRGTRATTFVITAAFGLNACVTPLSAPPKTTKAEREEEIFQQRTLVLQTLLKKQERVNRISFALSKANAPLCPRGRTMFGFGYHSAAQYKGDYAKAGEALYQFDGLPKVLYVINGSPAAKAGLAVGDEFIALDEDNITPGDKVFAGFAKMMDAKKAEAISFRVRRDGEIIDIAMTPVRVCDIPIGVSRSAAINAKANGRYVTINDGMLRFAQTDEELALVIAHEFAHNTMGHVRAQSINIGLGLAGGLVLDVALIAFGVFTPAIFSQSAAGAAYLTYSAEFEQEADYVGAYYFVRAGYNVDIAEDFWRRMGAQNPGSITKKSTHPPTATRFVAMDKAFEEIAIKQDKGALLVPDVKPGREPITQRSPEKGDPALF